MALINHVEWIKTCALCKGKFPLNASCVAQLRQTNLRQKVARLIVKHYITVNTAATGVFITTDPARYH